MAGAFGEEVTSFGQVHLLPTPAGYGIIRRSAPQYRAQAPGEIGGPRATDCADHGLPGSRRRSGALGALDRASSQGFACPRRGGSSQVRHSCHRRPRRFRQPFWAQIPRRGSPAAAQRTRPHSCRRGEVIRSLDGAGGVGRSDVAEITVTACSDREKSRSGDGIHHPVRAPDQLGILTRCAHELHAERQAGGPGAARQRDAGHAQQRP